MAKATGQIVLSNAIDLYTRVTIDDGQGNGHSELTFSFETSNPSQSKADNPVSGTAHNNFTFDGNATKVVQVYQGRTTNSNHTAYIFMDFTSESQDAAFWQDVSTGGSTPAILEFRDYEGNTVNVTFVNTASHTDGTAVSNSSYSRKISDGNYELNTNSGLTGANVRDDLLDILKAARDNTEISIHASTFTRVTTSGFLQFSAPGNGIARAPMSARIKRASGSWAKTSKSIFRAVVIDSGHVMARIDTPDDPVYSINNNSTDADMVSANSTLRATALAEYLVDMINSSPIQISASNSGGTISLTNDNHGTAGNTTITSLKWSSGTSSESTTGISITSFSGGTAESGGGSDMAQKRMTISAKQMELKASGGLSGSADNKAALVLDLDGLAEKTSVAQSDVLAMHVSGEAAPKKVSFSDLEDAVFASISGDASVAAGGALTISDDAVENSMILSGTISNGKLANDSVTVVAGDALTGGGEVDLGASITLDVAVDDSSIEVSGDALQVKALGITNGMLAGSIASSKIAELNSFDTDDLSEGSSNQYFTQARARGSISVTDAGGDGSMSYDSSTGVLTYTGPSAAEVRAHLSAGNMLDFASGEFSVNASDFSGSFDAALATKDTGDLAEGSNLYYTDARARASISVTDAGGDGSMSYNSSTGVLTYTGPSAAEVRAHFSAGTGVSITDGEVAIGQPVATTDDVQFADLVLTGDLTVGGTTTTVNSTEVAIVDKAIVLGSGSTDSQVAAASGAGLKIGDEASPLATFLYDGVDSWDLSDHLNLASGQHLAIADANMLDADGAAKVRSAVAGDGLGHSAGLLSVNVDDSSIEIDSDSLQVKALGITNAMLSGAIASSKIAELNNFDTDDLSEGSSNQYFTQARARGSISVTDAGGDGSMSYDSSTGVLTYTGPSAAEVRAHLSAGNMLDFASGEFSVNASDFSGSFDAALATKDTGDLAEGSNLYYTDTRARAAISVTDAGGDGSMSYDSSTGVITYTGPSAAEVRAHISVTDNGGDGSLSYDSSTGVISYTGPSAAEVRAHMSAGNMIDFSAGEIAVNAAAFSGSWDAALATKDTDDLAEGDNLYFTDARARAAVSVTDAGGDGSLSYNSSTGVITYTGPSAAEVRAHMSGAAGIDFSAGAISVNVDDSSIEISGDALQVKAQGIATSMLADDAVTPAKIADGIAGDGIQVSAGVLSISQAQEIFASTDLSSNVATLSGTPASDKAVFVFMNGLLLAEGSDRDYTISGQAITLASENAMQSEDELVVKFINQ